MSEFRENMGRRWATTKHNAIRGLAGAALFAATQDGIQGSGYPIKPGIEGLGTTLLDAGVVLGKGVIYVAKEGVKLTGQGVDVARSEIASETK